MKWYLKKPRLKLRDAFRETFYEQFEDTIGVIQDCSKDVLREANLSSMAETKQIGSTVEDIRKQLRLDQIDGRLSRIERAEKTLRSNIGLRRFD